MCTGCVQHLDLGGGTSSHLNCKPGKVLSVENLGTLISNLDYGPKFAKFPVVPSSPAAGQENSLAVWRSPAALCAFCAIESAPSITL